MAYHKFVMELTTLALLELHFLLQSGAEGVERVTLGDDLLVGELNQGVNVALLRTFATELTTPIHSNPSRICFC